jgi:hypothetical protein
MVDAAMGLGRKDDEMSDGQERYWFVAAVFRKPRDLAATVAELGAAALPGDRLLVVSRFPHDEALQAIDQTGKAALRLVTMQGDGGWHDGDGRMSPPRVELRSILAAMQGNESAPQAVAGTPSTPMVREGQGQIYAQLRQDVTEGAYVLIASVANAQEQLQGARILLRGNCECVLTHELVVPHA